MAKSKLKTALDSHKGRNIKLEKQRKKEKAARQRKEKNQTQEDNDNAVDAVETEETETKLNGNTNGTPKVVKANGLKAAAAAVGDAEWETDESENEDDMLDQPALDLSHLDDSDSDISGDDVDETLEDEDVDEDKAEEAGEEDIALSDIESLAEEDRGDIIPHQRLTINNTAALTAAFHRIQLPYSKLPFSEHMSTTSAEPVSIPDADDDLERELAFYKQSLAAAKDARAQLKKEGAVFSRPADYFAEMVKSDEHMGKIKQKLIDTAAGKKASAEARKQRDLKKFGKQVQVAKLQERAKEKRDTMDKINVLKRKRAGADMTATNEEDLFDVELDRTDDPSTVDRRDRSGKPGSKRQKKNEKFGFGGKKRHAKSNDAQSSADGRAFSHRKMKEGGQGGGKGRGKMGAAQRPGKSRRAKQR